MQAVCDGTHSLVCRCAIASPPLPSPHLYFSPRYIQSTLLLHWHCVHACACACACGFVPAHVGMEDMMSGTDFLHAICLCIWVSTPEHTQYCQVFVMRMFWLLNTCACICIHFFKKELVMGIVIEPILQRSPEKVNVEMRGNEREMRIFASVRVSHHTSSADSWWQLQLFPRCRSVKVQISDSSEKKWWIIKLGIDTIYCIFLSICVCAYMSTQVHYQHWMKNNLHKNSQWHFEKVQNSADC